MPWIVNPDPRMDLNPNFPQWVNMLTGDWDESHNTVKLDRDCTFCAKPRKPHHCQMKEGILCSLFPSDICLAVILFHS